MMDRPNFELRVFTLSGQIAGVLQRPIVAAKHFSNCRPGENLRPASSAMHSKQNTPPVSVSIARQKDSRKARIPGVGDFEFAGSQARLLTGFAADNISCHQHSAR